MKIKSNHTKDNPLILFITVWYPINERPYWGIFVRRYAESIAKNCRVVIFHPVPVIDLPKCTTEINSHHNIEVYTLYYGVNNADSLIKKIKNLFNGYRSQYRGIKDILNRYDVPDIVHLQVVYPFGWLALYLKYFHKIPYLITEHWTGYSDSSNKFKGILRKFLTKKIINNAKYVTTVSTALMNSMKKHGLKNNYLVIPNVVEIYEDLNHTNLQNSNDKIKILTVGNLKNIHKNIEGIIRAVKNISKIRTDFELYIVGDGQDRINLEDLVNSLSLTGCVKFTGPVSDRNLGQYYTKSDFFVMNSNYETFSVVTAEALGYGLPVIITRCGGPEEFVKEDMGIIIEPKNQKQLEDAILNMLDNFQNYDKNYLHEYIKSKFSSETIGSLFYELYQNTLKNNENINPKS